MLHLKKLLTLILALTLVVGAVGCTSSKSQEDAPAVVEFPDEIRQQYPAFCGLDTTNGLTVYVAKFSQNYVACSLYSTTDAQMDLSKLDTDPRVDLATMKTILSCYNLPAEAITVIPYYSPLSSYIAPDLFEELGMAEVLYELGLGEKPAKPVDDTEDAPFPYTLAWAGVSEEGEYALRYTYYPITDSFAYQNELTYITIGIKSRQELDSFLSLASRYFSLSSSMPGKNSFNAIIQKYDEAFFEGNGLVIVYIPSESTSINYKLESAAATGEELHITVTEAKPEGELNAQEAGWFMTVEFSQEQLSNVTHFSAG